MALPDFRLQSAPDRIVRGLGGDGHLIDSRGLRVLPAGNANRIQYGVLIGGAGGALVASGGGNIVQTAVGGPMSIITMDPAHLQQVLAGRAAVGSIVASGIIGPPRTAPMQVLSVGGPVTVTQFSPAASTWANRSGLVVQWNFAGAAPADQRVIVQYQVGGRSYMGCPAMPISNRSCQIPGADFAPLLRTTTAGTLSLLDGATQRLLMTAPMTIRIP
ncbi:MAG: hypothetical protein NTV52_04590 [Acidobacteria bacterium]|nr:hypothetical protein [Acidobacteriota bacterium]